MNVPVKPTVIPLLTKSLTPPALDKHRAEVGLSLEIIVRKFDKFGWDRLEPGMRKALRADWMDALQDYPIDEINTACRRHVRERPDKIPNEGHILGLIIKARGEALRLNPAPKPVEPARAEPDAESKQRVADITRQFQRMKGA